VVDALVDAGFEVSVLTRTFPTSSDFPPSVTVHEVDYACQKELVAALKNQDAVVSTLAALAQEAQIQLIDAAVEAGVQRFLPSEYGLDSTDERVITELKVYSGKVKTVNHVKSMAAEGKIGYSILITGLYLDFCLGNGLLVSFDQRSC
jgi:hypothetical protein